MTPVNSTGNYLIRDTKIIDLCIGSDCLGISGSNHSKNFNKDKDASINSAILSLILDFDSINDPHITRFTKGMGSLNCFKLCIIFH